MFDYNYKLVFVKSEYFQNHVLEEALKSEKKDEFNRPYAFLSIKYKNNNIFVPIRSKILAVQPFGIIGYSIPSDERRDAGLDYRKLLIINDLEYIEFPSYEKIPNSQKKIIDKDISTIQAQVVDYIKGYEKSFNKNRTKKDGKYKFSTLCNYHKELGLE